MAVGTYHLARAGTGVSMARKKQAYIVAPGVAVEHSGDGRRYEAGAAVNLDHLDPATVRRLVEAGVVLGEAPPLPLEAMGVPAGAAARLWNVGIREPAHLLAPSAPALGAMAGVDADQARAWQQAAEGPRAEKE